MRDIFRKSNTYRGKETKIYMKEKDRQRHMYIIGKSGSGKSVMLQALNFAGIFRQGHGVSRR